MNAKDGKDEVSRRSFIRNAAVRRRGCIDCSASCAGEGVYSAQRQVRTLRALALAEWVAAI